jgi:predicted transcriptional regulator
MLISEYISKDFPAFEVDSSAEETLEIASEFGFTHVFVQKNNLFLGGICKEFLEENPDKNLEELLIHIERFAILEGGTVLDTVKLFYTFNANIIPIINKNEEYLGYIAYDDVFNELSKYPLFSENGAVLTVETNLKSFSMTEIAKIVESNNSKFYGAFISHVNDDVIQVTMKINHDNLSSIDETFDRFGYHVVHKFYNDEKEDLIKDRYQYFQKYLEF